MELPQAWKLWADEVEANNLALHNQLDWMWVVIALLCLIMVALVAWLRRTHALHLKTLGERVTEHSVHDQLAVHCKQLEEELVRLWHGQLLPRDAIVTRRGERHAVLVVAFESGDVVLDNLTPWPTPWADLGYTWIQRQVAGSNAWTTVS